MTAAPITATCSARFPLAGAPAVPCDRQPHKTRLHTAEIDGIPFAWSDRDTDPMPAWERAMLAAVRAAYGDDLPATAAARVEAIGCAAITLQSHQWTGVDPDVAAEACTCGWRGQEHERHVAEQLYATGALGRIPPAVALVVEKARRYAGRLRHTPDWEERLTLTPEAKQLVAAVDTLDNPGGGT